LENRQKPFVLAVEDDPALVRSLQSVLSAAGFDVAPVPSGREALGVIKAVSPNVVLAGLRLPDMSALELLRQLRDSGSHPPLIVVSGGGATRDVVEAIRHGAVDFVEKPIAPLELLRVVEKALPAGERASFADLTPEPHALARWVRALIPVVQSLTDPRTVQAWSVVAGVSQGALKTWCRMAGFSTKESLDFARLLRAVVRRGTHGYRAQDSLDVVDRRTLVGLLRFGGVRSGDPADLPWSVDEFLAQQTLVRDLNAIRLLKASLQRVVELPQVDRPEQPS
jgi:FixJ family two-component response regulator